MRTRVSPLAGALFVAGLLMVAHTAITLVWQEPFSRATAKAAQERATLRLGRLSAARLGPADLVRVSKVSGDRAQVAYLADRLDRRTDVGEALGRIRIPRLGVSFAFVDGTETDALKRGPGHYEGTALPGMPGTVGLAGHRTTYLAPFRNINRLRRHDRIELRMPYGTFTYAVEGTAIVSPEDVRVLRTVHHDRIVLTACHPLASAKQRIIVSAALVSSHTKAARLQVRGDAHVLVRIPQTSELPQRLASELPALTARPRILRG